MLAPICGFAANLTLFKVVRRTISDVQMMKMFFVFSPSIVGTLFSKSSSSRTTLVTFHSCDDAYSSKPSVLAKARWSRGDQEINLRYVH